MAPSPPFPPLPMDPVGPGRARRLAPLHFVLHQVRHLVPDLQERVNRCRRPPGPAMAFRRAHSGLLESLARSAAVLLLGLRERRVVVGGVDQCIGVLLTSRAVVLRGWSVRAARRAGHQVQRDGREPAVNGPRRSVLLAVGLYVACASRPAGVPELAPFPGAQPIKHGLYHPIAVGIPARPAALVSSSGGAERAEQERPGHPPPRALRRLPQGHLKMLPGLLQLREPPAAEGPQLGSNDSSHTARLPPKVVDQLGHAGALAAHRVREGPPVPTSGWRPDALPSSIQTWPSGRGSSAVRPLRLGSRTNRAGFTQSSGAAWLLGAKYGPHGGAAATLCNSSLCIIFSPDPFSYVANMAHRLLCNGSPSEVDV